MNQRNKMKLPMAFVAVAILIGMALMGLFVPTEVSGDIEINNDLVESVSLSDDWAFDTSTVDINISYSLAPTMISWELSNLTITVEEVGSAILPEQLYRWNLTEDGDSPVDPFIWSLDGTQTVGNWLINVTADYYNHDDGVGHTGSGEAHFSVIDGTHIIKELSANPIKVDNSGMDMTNLSFKVNRNLSEIDHEKSDGAFFHVNTMSWVPHETLEIPEPEMQNLTEGDHNMSVFMHLVIPEDLPVGEYKLFFNVYDIWGYNESVNVTMFNVIWKELPPIMNNGTVYMEEDEFAVVDLDDHFMDKNHQELSYYINTSAVENLTINWEDEMENVINITAPENWNGEQTFDLYVTDGIDLPGHNVSFTMTVIVIPVDDPLMVAEDVTIEINEMEMEATFNPQNLFYDPDGEVEDLTVSLGWEWAVNETNVTYMMPIWSWNDGNFSVMINETDNTDGMAMMLEDLEEGSADFPISAWINGTWVLNGTATVEIIPVNDVPMPVQSTIVLFMNEGQTFNLSELFEDPDSSNLNFSVNSTMTENVEVIYNWETFDLTLTPAVNWTGTTMFKVNATDMVDHMEYTMIVEVIKRSYAITGSVNFEDVDGVHVNLSNVTLMIGDETVALDENGSFMITLEEGDYAFSLEIPEDLLYSEEDEQSGYEIPAITGINLTENMDFPIAVSYRVYEPTGEIIEASWDDLDFEGVEFEDDDDLKVILNIKEGTEDHVGFESMILRLIIKESNDEELNFTLSWDEENMYFFVILDDEALNGLGKGKKEYYFTNEDGSLTSEINKYAFKGEDSSGSAMTIIILVALIILVLIALIFIMRKPSEEDFDEEEDEEEDGRTCPGCGEIITDDEAEECPYCGENIEEE